MSGHPVLPPDPITLPLLPLRDVVVFPHMVIPLFVGRPKSIKALEAAMEGGRQIMLVAQKAAGKDEPRPEDMFAIGCVSSILQMLKLPDGTVKVLVEGLQRAEHAPHRRHRRALRGRGVAGSAGGRDHARGRGAAPRGDAAVRPVRQAQQEDPARNPHLDRRHRRSRPPGRHHRGAPAAQARGQAVGARPRLGGQAAREAARAARARSRHPAGRKAHPWPRQAPDGEEPARVLPERAGQGDPEGTRRRRRRCRPRRAREEDQGRAHAQGGAQEGRRRAEEAQADVADVGRGHRRAQLHRHAGRACPGARRPRSSTTCGMAEQVLNEDHYGPREGQGTHPRVPRGAAARRQGQGADPVPGRASGRGQDLARPERGARHRPQVRAHGAGRRARRGRDPRPPPHLHRLDAGQGAAEPHRRSARATRCSCSTRSTSWAWTSAATRRRRCSKCSTPSRTTPSATTTSRSTSTCPT